MTLTTKLKLAVAGIVVVYLLGQALPALISLAR